ncbi:MAG: serine/threonine-protein kinase PknK [Anaerolineae bacterium]
MDDGRQILVTRIQGEDDPEDEASTHDPALDRVIGGRYRLLDRLGAGGMGVVYRAHDAQADRWVALKLLFPHHVYTEGARRFRREFRALSRLHHPHIVRVFDFGLEDDQAYYAMEYVVGLNLAQWQLQQGDQLSRPAWLTIARQLAEALAYIHAQGIIHRDIKPENVMIVESSPGDGGLSAKLMDFGVAKLVEATTHLTEPGSLLGTAAYMAPEQAQKLAVDYRADLYALGVLLYEAATGARPFTADDPVALALQHIGRDPAPPRSVNPDLPPAVEAIILRLLVKQPQARYPSAEALLADLARIDGAVPAIMPQPEQVRADIVFESPLVGRETEMGQLIDWLREAADGAGRLVLIGGEAGVGKTRLTQELTARARWEDMQVLAGACHPQERMPYQPFVEALETYFSRLDDAAGWVLRDAVGPLAAEWLKLVPALVGRSFMAEIPPGADLGPEPEKLRLFTSVRLLLQRAAQSAPLLVVLEDLHWAEEGTLELLGYLARNALQEPVLLCGTYRTEEAHPLAAWTREVTKAGLEVLVLPPLDEAETATLVAGALGLTDRPQQFAQYLYQRTNGNPFFVEEVLKSLTEAGILYRRDGAWHADMDASRYEQLRVPSTIESVIADRLSRLGAESRQALNWAAVIGQAFDFEVWLRVLAWDEDTLLDVSDELLRARAVTEEGRTGNHYAFSQNLIREVVYHGLSRRRRRRMHQVVGEHMEAVCAGKLETVAAELAHHFDGGQVWDKALDYHVQAGNRARETYANAEAIAHYSRALTLLGRLTSIQRERGEGDEGQVEARRFAILAARESVYDLLGRRDAQRQDLETMLALAEARQDTSWLAEVCLRQAHFFRVIGDYTSAEGSAARALSLQEKLGDLAGKVVALAALGQVYGERSEYPESLTHLESALDLCHQIDDPAAKERVHRHLGDVYHDLCDYPQALRHYQVAEEISRRRDDRWGVGIVRGKMGNVYRLLGQYERARQLYQDALDTHRQVGDRHGEAHALGNIGNIYRHAGRYPEATHHYERTLAICEEVGDRWAAGLSAVNLGLVCASEGDLIGALTYLERALTIAREIESEHLRIFSLNSLSALQRERGEAERALRYAVEATELARQRALVGDEVEGLGNQGMAHLAVGDTEPALSCTTQAVDLMDAHVPIGGFDTEEKTLFYHARALAANGRRVEARAILERAHTVVMDKADRIADPLMRQSFLDQVRLNQAILNAVAGEGHGGGEDRSIDP